MEARKLGTEGSGCLLVGFFFLGFFWGGGLFKGIHTHTNTHTHTHTHVHARTHTRACIHVLWYAHGSQKTTNPS